MAGEHISLYSNPYSVHAQRGCAISEAGCKFIHEDVSRTVFSLKWSFQPFTYDSPE